MYRMSKILVYNIGLFLDSVWFGMLHQITLKAIVRNLYTLDWEKGELETAEK